MLKNKQIGASNLAQVKFMKVLLEIITSDYNADTSDRAKKYNNHLSL